MNNGPAVLLNVPAGTYRTMDSWIAVTLVKEEQFDTLCKIIEEPQLPQDYRFNSFETRAKNKHTLMDIIQNKIKTKTSKEWLSLFTKENILTSPVNSLGDWLEDPHVNAIEGFSEIYQPSLGKIPIASLPGGRPLEGIAPGIGSDTEEILISNGFSQKEINELIKLMSNSSKPVFYTGGGVINSGPKASELLRELVNTTGFPITSTLQGLGSYPGEDSQFLGMLGMHGSYEANNAMHDCDLMINIGARFDDRITGKIDEFSPKSKKVHIDIDPSSINKNVKVDLPIVGDVTEVITSTIKTIKKVKPNFAKSNKQQISKWWQQIQKWRSINSFDFVNSTETIKPQYAVQRLYELTKNKDTYITTEVGQHQMWAAQHYKFDKPNRWMTSGGLGTMGYGLPAAVGVQVAHPNKLVIDIAGEASVLMTMQEMSTAVQYSLPIKIFILNNEYMGMVRQWQELLHDKNYSESYLS